MCPGVPRPCDTGFSLIQSFSGCCRDVRCHACRCAGFALPCLLGIIIISSSTACSTSDFGVGLNRCVRQDKNKTATLLGVKAWGIHLVTVPGHTALNIGSLESVYVFPNPPAASAVNVASRELKVDECEKDDITAPHDTTPIASASRLFGVSLDANPQRIGIFAGVRDRSALILPRDFNGIVAIMLNPSNPEDSKVQIEKKEKVKP